MLQQQQHQEVLLHPIQRKIQEYRPFVRFKKKSVKLLWIIGCFLTILIMVFHRNLLPILVLLVAVNSRFGLALPYQSIRLDPSDVPFIYNLNASWTETCPGGETDCAPGETCCPLKNQGYGCCPYKDAVCCSDQLSCCPGGTQCNIIERICDPTNKDDAVTTAKELKEAKPIHIELTPIEDAIKIQFRIIPDNSGLCPDHKMRCPDRTTCCKLYDGGYGCCPYPEGVCCKDGAHCCPHATQCDIQHGRCIRSHFLPMLMGLPEFNDIDPPMEKVLMMIWKVKQPVSTGYSIQKVSGQKLPKTIIV